MRFMTERGRSRQRYLQVVLYALVGAALLGCGSEQPPPAEKPKPVAWAMAEMATTGRTRSITGVLQTPARAPMGFNVPGRVAT